MPSSILSEQREAASTLGCIEAGVPVSLKVRDNGKGAATPGGVGLDLVGAFAEEELGGTLEVTVNNSISFFMISIG